MWQRHPLGWVFFKAMFGRTLEMFVGPWDNLGLYGPKVVVVDFLGIFVLGKKYL